MDTKNEDSFGSDSLDRSLRNKCVVADSEDEKDDVPSLDLTKHTVADNAILIKSGNPPKTVTDSIRNNLNDIAEPDALSSSMLNLSNSSKDNEIDKSNASSSPQISLDSIQNELKESEDLTSSKLIDDSNCKAFEISTLQGNLYNIAHSEEPISNIINVNTSSTVNKIENYNADSPREIVSNSFENESGKDTDKKDESNLIPPTTETKSIINIATSLKADSSAENRCLGIDSGSNPNISNCQTEKDVRTLQSTSPTCSKIADRDSSSKSSLNLAVDDIQQDVNSILNISNDDNTIIRLDVQNIPPKIVSETIADTPEQLDKTEKIENETDKSDKYENFELPVDVNNDPDYGSEDDGSGDEGGGNRLENSINTVQMPLIKCNSGKLSDGKDKDSNKVENLIDPLHLPVYKCDSAGNGEEVDNNGAKNTLHTVQLFKSDIGDAGNGNNEVAGHMFENLLGSVKLSVTKGDNENAGNNDKGAAGSKVENALDTVQLSLPICSAKSRRKTDADDTSTSSDDSQKQASASSSKSFGDFDLNEDEDSESTDSTNGNKKSQNSKLFASKVKQISENLKDTTLGEDENDVESEETEESSTGVVKKLDEKKNTSITDDTMSSSSSDNDKTITEESLPQHDSLRKSPTSPELSKKSGNELGNKEESSSDVEEVQPQSSNETATTSSSVLGSNSSSSHLTINLRRVKVEKFSSDDENDYEDESDYEEEEDDDHQSYPEDNEKALMEEVTRRLSLRPLSFTSPYARDNIARGIKSEVPDDPELDEAADNALKLELRRELPPENGIQKIIGKHTLSGKIQYLFRWVDKLGLHWESEEFLLQTCPSLVKKYENDRELEREQHIRYLRRRERNRQRFSNY